MTGKAWKIAVTTVVLLGAFGGLLWSTLRDGTEYYKHVEEVTAQPNDWYGKRLQLHGYVVAELDHAPARHPGLSLPGAEQGPGGDGQLHGIVPDTFKDDAEVVLKGTLSPRGSPWSPTE